VKGLLAFLSLFTSLGTLLCCALPALFVAIGMGAAFAGLVGAVPQIVWLSEKKLWLFGIGALCLLLAVESVAGVLLRMVVQDSGPRSLGGLLVAIVSQVISALLSVVFFVMLARIYAQLSGGAQAQPSVPSSGT